MDSFKEQIIKKEITRKDNTLRFLITFAGVALAFAAIMFAIMFRYFLPMAFFVGAVIIYGAVYLIQNLNLEYEYIFTNGDLDIDKIMAARSRKHMITIKINDVTDVGEYSENIGGDRTTVIASAMSSEMTDWYLDFKHHEYGETRLIFTPDDDMLRVIKSHLPRTIRNKITVADKPSEEE